MTQQVSIFSTVFCFQYKLSNLITTKTLSFIHSNESRTVPDTNNCSTQFCVMLSLLLFTNLHCIAFPIFRWITYTLRSLCKGTICISVTELFLKDFLILLCSKKSSGSTIDFLQKSWIFWAVLCWMGSKTFILKHSKWTPIVMIKFYSFSSFFESSLGSPLSLSVTG